MKIPSWFYFLFFLIVQAFMEHNSGFKTFGWVTCEHLIRLCYAGATFTPPVDMLALALLVSKSSFKKQQPTLPLKVWLNTLKIIFRYNVEKRIM